MHSLPRIKKLMNSVLIPNREETSTSAIIMAGLYDKLRRISLEDVLERL